MFMSTGLPVFRSLTAAYQAVERLRRAGIPAKLVNTPHTGAGQGCSYSIVVHPRYQARAEALFS